MPISGEASRALAGPPVAGDRKIPEACGEFLILLLFIRLLRTSSKILEMIFKSKLHKIILHVCDSTVHTFKSPMKPKHKPGTGAGVLSPAICEAKTRGLLEPQKDGGGSLESQLDSFQKYQGQHQKPHCPWTTLCLLVPSFSQSSCLHGLLHFSCIHTVGCWISQDFSWVQQNPWQQRPQEEGIPFMQRFQAILVGSLWQPGNGLEECLHWLPHWVCPFHSGQLPSLWEWATSIQPLPEVGFSESLSPLRTKADAQN